MKRVSEQPDWAYLLREFDGIYRRGSAGGSKDIRRHQRQVAEALGRLLTMDPELRPREGQSKPVEMHLGRALDNGLAAPLAPLVRAVARIAGDLSWEYGYERIPKNLAKKYAYAELLGPHGPVVFPGLILGLVLFAPGCVYPQHAHGEISESYVSLSGAWSENNEAVYAPGSLILNRPGHEHRITVGDREPCLLAYAWVGPAERLAAPGMTFSRAKRGA